MQCGHDRERHAAFLGPKTDAARWTLGNEARASLPCSGHCGHGFIIPLNAFILISFNAKFKINVIIMNM